MEKVEKTKQCKECCRDITEDDYNAHDGYCMFCYPDKEEILYSKENYNNAPKTSYRELNKIATIIKIIAIIVAIVGVCIGIGQFESYRTEELGWIYIIVSIISAVFVYALGEIIQLLEDIKNKLKPTKIQL